MKFSVKRWFQGAVGLASLLALAACGNLQNADLSGTETTASSNKSASYQITGSTDGTQYSALLANGKYKVSTSRGLTVDQNSNTFNTSSFEAGLTTISKSNFSPEKYAFQEGQHISRTTANSWLKRESANNEAGLNPKDNGSTDPDKRAPIYLQEILEQDYLQRTNNSYQTAGVAIGLGLNEIDYYQKVQYGATFKTTISQAEREKQGKAMAVKILARLRKKKELADVTIVFGLYKQAANDSLVGGTYFATAVSKSGTTISEWKTLNQENGVLPVVNNQKAVNDGDADSFGNFKTKIQAFFPNLSGVTAQTHYENGTLQGMKIKISTQFFGVNEIQSFTQYVDTAAKRYLPANIPIEITISSVEGMQSFLSRESGDKDFYTHVFSSY
ncbi:CamS family sex pheromone protein [Lapidilactobacillus achengensis]|uniref:CamS family sex pheromone protein n=1 Tax=Lapidilactobacillus achengensis TaxID=2486000 RepID=A0ABW1UK60_9LACO|nr:CamS family sex pheromone protein [Lapidilactobacillus achengensis]